MLIMRKKISYCNDILSFTILYGFCLIDSRKFVFACVAAVYDEIAIFFCSFVSMLVYHSPIFVYYVTIQFYQDFFNFSSPVKKKDGYNTL